MTAIPGTPEEHAVISMFLPLLGTLDIEEIAAAADGVLRIRALRRAEAHVAAGGDLLALPKLERIEHAKHEFVTNSWAARP